MRHKCDTNEIYNVEKGFHEMAQKKWGGGKSADRSGAFQGLGPQGLPKALKGPGSFGAPMGPGPLTAPLGAAAKPQIRHAIEDFLDR